MEGEVEGVGQYVGSKYRKGMQDVIVSIFCSSRKVVVILSILCLCYAHEVRNSNIRKAFC